MNALTASLSAVVILGMATTASAQSEAQWVTKTTERSVEDAVNSLQSAIEGVDGASVMATVDHRENAESADLDLPATTVVIFGNPNIGTPLMQENRRIAIDLPQKMLIWDDDGLTTIGYLMPEALAARYGIDPSHESIQTMTGALDRLSSAAAGE